MHSLAAPLLRRRDPLLPTTATPARGFLHLPVLALGAKVIAGATVKKVAMHQVLKKLGPERALKLARDVNSSLHRAQPGMYPPALQQHAADSIDALERSLSGIREEESLRRAWQWYERLEKDNPSLATMVIKSYLESFTSMKYASAVLGPLMSGGAPAAAVGAASEALPAQLPDDPAEVERQTSLVAKACAAVPELDDYHVVLIPKRAVDEEARGDQGEPR
jgi:hypothetical protein